MPRMGAPRSKKMTFSTAVAAQHEPAREALQVDPPELRGDVAVGELAALDGRGRARLGAAVARGRDALGDHLREHVARHLDGLLARLVAELVGGVEGRQVRERRRRLVLDVAAAASAVMGAMGVRSKRSSGARARPRARARRERRRRGLAAERAHGARDVEHLGVERRVDALGELDEERARLGRAARAARASSTASAAATSGLSVGKARAPGALVGVRAPVAARRPACPRRAGPAAGLRGPGPPELAAAAVGHRRRDALLARERPRPSGTFCRRARTRVTRSARRQRAREEAVGEILHARLVVGLAHEERRHAAARHGAHLRERDRRIGVHDLRREHDDVRPRRRDPPRQALARLDGHRLEARRHDGPADAIRFVGAGDDEHLHAIPETNTGPAVPVTAGASEHALRVDVDDEPRVAPELDARRRVRRRHERRRARAPRARPGSGCGPARAGWAPGAGPRTRTASPAGRARRDAATAAAASLASSSFDASSRSDDHARERRIVGLLAGAPQLARGRSPS